MRDPTELFQGVFDSLSPLLEPGWIELALDYHVDDAQSDLAGSYLIRKGSGLEEVAILAPHAVDSLLRELRASAPGHLGQPFSRCKLRVSQGDGAFKVDYAYDAIDWTKLLTASNWNFTEAPTKRGSEAGGAM